MQLTVTSSHGASVLKPIGRIDQASADAFLSALQPHLASCTRDSAPLILDFSAVDYISSVGLRALMIAARQVRATHGKIAIAALQPLVREVFGIARFDLVIPYFECIADASKGVSV